MKIYLKFVDFLFCVCYNGFVSIKIYRNNAFLRKKYGIKAIRREDEKRYFAIYLKTAADLPALPQIVGRLTGARFRNADGTGA